MSTEFVIVDELYDHNSSVIRYARYSDQRVLYVGLRNGGIAAYEDVDQDTWEEFKNASSRGAFWNRYIRGVYRGTNADFDFKSPAKASVTQSDELLVVKAMRPVSAVVSASALVEFLKSNPDLVDVTVGLK